MKVIHDKRCTEYHKNGHPERPQRILTTVEKLKNQTELQISWEAPLAVADDQILLAHTPQHLQSLSQSMDFDPDTPAYPEIEQHARRAAGAALHALQFARAGETAFSLMRPPGHHATQNQAMGFCYLNSIAIAAFEARAKGTARVAVFDFDVHHGNGTEDIFVNREGVAYFSVHQFPAYPGTGKTHRGNNCFNYPVAPGAPAETYRAACSAAIEKIRDYKPDLLGVSAGFDAYRGDLLCDQNMEIPDFHWLGKTIRQLGIPTFSILEGGYSKALPELILAYLKGWNGID